MAEAPSGNPRKSPASLDIDDLVRLLRASGSRHAGAEQVRADIDAGAPANADGTVHLVRYAAWLARQAGGSEANRGH